MIPLIIAGVAAAASAAASAIGAAMAAGDEAEARRIRAKLAAEYSDVPLPDLDKLIAEHLPDNLADKYTRNTQATMAQGNALRGLQQLVDSGGETDIEKAAYLRSQMETARQAAGATGAIQASLANRGLGGSGLEAALMAQAGQDAVDRGAMANADNAANAQARRLDALRSLGSMAGSMRGQELDAMGAVDAIQQFNFKQRMGAAQQTFNNTMAKLAGKSGAMGAVADDHERAGARTRGVAAGIGGAISDFGDVAAGEFGGGRRKKKREEW